MRSRADLLIPSFFCRSRTSARRPLQVALGALGGAGAHTSTPGPDQEDPVESGSDGEALEVRGEGVDGGAEEDRRVRSGSSFLCPRALFDLHPIHLAVSEWTGSSWDQEDRRCRQVKRESRCPRSFLARDARAHLFSTASSHSILSGLLDECFEIAQDIRALHEDDVPIPLRPVRPRFSPSRLLSLTSIRINRSSID